MLPLLSTPCSKTTTLARKAMDALIGQTFTVCVKMLKTKVAAS
jgi:hypothetical protein